MLCSHVLQLLRSSPEPPLHGASSRHAGGNWWRSAARLAGFIVFLEALRRTFFSDHAVQALLAAQPWQAWAVGYCVLAALFGQSYGGCGRQLA